MKKHLLFFRFLCWLPALLLTTAQADPGNGIVADSKGNIFYTDLARVWKLDPAGVRTVAVPDVHTHELYIDAQDNLFGEHLWYNGETANTWGHYVWKRDGAGKISKVINDTTGFLEGYSFVRDAAGNMYELEKSIPSNFWKIAPDGRRTLLGSIALRNIGRLHFSKKGILYFYNGDDVWQLRAGDSIRLFRGNMAGNKCERCIESVWTDDDENVFVAISARKIIQRVGVNGDTATIYTSSGEWYPVGGVFDKNKQLWVLEYNDKNETRCQKAESAPAASGMRNRLLYILAPAALLLLFLVVKFAPRRVNSEK